MQTDLTPLQHLVLYQVHVSGRHGRNVANLNNWASVALSSLIDRGLLRMRTDGENTAVETTDDGDLLARIYGEP